MFRFYGRPTWVRTFSYVVPLNLPIPSHRPYLAETDYKILWNKSATWHEFVPLNLAQRGRYSISLRGIFIISIEEADHIPTSVITLAIAYVLLQRGLFDH